MALNLDFLSPERREFILKYPFIVSFLNDEIDFSTLLSNWEAFKKEGSFLEQKERVGIQSCTFFCVIRFALKIRENAGYIVFCQNVQRSDTNDWPPWITEVPEKDVYIRCYHHILAKSRGEDTGKLIEVSIGQSFPFSISHLFSDFDLFMHGDLVCSQHVRGFEKRGFIFKRRVPKDQYMHYRPTLDELITQGNGELASFIALTINSDILDRAGRSGARPVLMIVLNDELRQEIVSGFQRNYLDDYEEFINMLVNPKDFPNFTRAMIKDRLPTNNKVLFVDADSVRNKAGIGSLYEEQILQLGKVGFKDPFHPNAKHL